MTSNIEMKVFCKSKGKFSIPLIQLEFSVTYKEAARVVDELVGAGEASPLADGLSYEYVNKERVMPSNGREVGASNSYSGDIASGHGYAAEKNDNPRLEYSEDEGDEDIDEDEMWRKRREYLERRRRELIAKIESIAKEEEGSDKDSKEDKEEEDGLFEDFDDDDNDDDGELIKSDDGEDDVDNVSEDTASQLDSILDEESLKKRLLAFMSDGGEISRLAIKALKLCAAEGYITDWLLQRELRMNDVESKYVCDILYRNNFIKCDCDPDKYILAVPEGLVYACFREIEERKNAFGGLINVLKNIGEQKRRSKPQTKTSACKHFNSFQLKKTVRQKLLDLLRIDPKITRTKAIIKVEGCLFAACDIGLDPTIAIYKKMLEELNDMSDYLFNRLKSSLQD